jgi:hypothetical protein
MGRAYGARRAPLGLAVALACFGGAYAVFSTEHLKRAALAVLLVLFGAAVLFWAAAMAHVGVVINAYNVRVRHGLLPVALLNLPMRTVRDIRAIDVTQAVWRRWGWTWVPGRSRSIVVRSGPALLFELRSGRRYVVSVDAPESAVAAVARFGVKAPAL